MIDFLRKLKIRKKAKTEIKQLEIDLSSSTNKFEKLAILDMIKMRKEYTFW